MTITDLPKQKQLFGILFFMLFFLNCKSQTFSGKIIDEAYSPIEYVNIGIVGKNIGTVSDENGNFTLSIHDQYTNDSLKYSKIGFKPLAFTVRNFKSIYPLDKIISIKLIKSTTTLKEITIKPKRFTSKILGNTTNSKSIVGGFESNDLGSEVGTVMKIKKSPTFIENVNFNIAENGYDSVTFRINIYSLKGGVPFENILTKCIFVTTAAEEKTLSVDLKEYNLVVESDFFVSLELVKDLKGKELYFSGGFLNSDSFSRKTSQGTWRKIELLGVGFNAKVSYEK